ncbi:MAG: DUF3857 domain-containing protein [Chitinophagaceae bacterium]|nr:DUF3857 domain-containing protein [Chitinophagaceae bacterium]
MNKLQTAIITVSVFLSAVCSAQSAGWQANPVVHKPAAQFAKESAVILEDDRTHEYQADSKKDLYVYVTNHRLVKVIDDKGVEMFNKIYIPYSNSEVMEVKARTIKPDGKVVELPADKIFDVEEDGKRYKKFALEGVEKNSEIEYMYRLKKQYTFFGTEVFQYGSIPFEKATFRLLVPEHLLFTVKGANGFTVGTDTVIDSKRVTTAKANNLPGLEDEKYGVVAPYTANIQYKFSYNLAKDKNVRLFTWNELAKRVYTNYTSFTEKEMKAAAGFLKQGGINENAAEEEKIRAVEDYIKLNINADKESIGEDAGKIEHIVKTKIASDEGVNSLFIACFEKLGINYQIVFPSKRDELPLDEDFENYRLADEIIFYFPNTGNFLEPDASALRYPYLQPYWSGTKGLFLKGTSIGTLKTAIASFDSIAIQPYEKSATNMEVQIKMNDAMDAVSLHSKQILMGYSAMSYRPAFNFLPKDKMDEFTKDVIKGVVKSEDIKNIKVANTAMTDCFANKPLTIEADVESPELIEKAGNRYFIKIGEVIGPQEQMYQEKPRQLPITIQYPHALDREITFIIPDGYEIKNLNDLNMNVVDNYRDQQTMGFISSYKLNGNQLKISLHEFYKITDYPLTMFEEFRKVINASADFNKVVLILVKKQ